MKDEDVLIDGKTKVIDWPNCSTPDCENKVCIWAKTGMCHPCSVKRLGKAEMTAHC
jgi:hypothetical protein